MDPLVSAVVGALVGYGAAHLHARIDGGWWLNLIAGALGGLLGAAWWTDGWVATFGDSDLAARAVAGAAGGAVVAISAGIVRNIVRWRVTSSRRIPG